MAVPVNGWDGSEPCNCGCTERCGSRKAPLGSDGPPEPARAKGMPVLSHNREWCVCRHPLSGHTALGRECIEPHCGCTRFVPWPDEKPWKGWGRRKPSVRLFHVGRVYRRRDGREVTVCSTNERSRDSRGYEAFLGDDGVWRYDREADRGRPTGTPPGGPKDLLYEEVASVSGG